MYFGTRILHFHLRVQSYRGKIFNIQISDWFLYFDTRTLDCVGGTDDKSVPLIVVPSKVDVAFGRYENTSYWYVNVSWTPLNGKKPFKPWMM